MKSKLTKAKAFWLSFLFSILAFVITCWSAAFQNTTPYWIESLAFFILTYICIDEFSKRILDLNPWMIAFAVILGQLILQTAVRATDFWGSIGSLMIAVSCIVAIVLAVICYKDNRTYTFILSYVVLAFFNTFIADMWHNYRLSL